MKPFRDAKLDFERTYVREALKRAGGNVSQAARLAKKDRKDFYELLRRTDIDPAIYRDRRYKWSEEQIRKAADGVLWPELVDDLITKLQEMFK